MKKDPTSFRLSREAIEWLKQIAAEDATNHTSILERLIRAEAKRRKLPKPTKEAPDE